MSITFFHLKSHSSSTVLTAGLTLTAADAGNQAFRQITVLAFVFFLYLSIAP